jgi:hypothetical protein
MAEEIVALQKRRSFATDMSEATPQPATAESRASDQEELILIPIFFLACCYGHGCCGWRLKQLLRRLL